MNKLKMRWKDTEDSCIGKKEYFFLSPSHYSIYRDLMPFFENYIKGYTLDLGAGRLGWKFLIEKFSSSYFSCDIKLESDKLTFISKGEDLSIKDKSLDTLVCIQVIEHVKNPRNILIEISRILKSNGCAIVSFPHLSYLHGEPEDYFRYTIYGFKSLCPSELVIEAFKESGGIVCFVFTPLFILINSIFYKIPVLGKLIFYLNSFLSTLVFYIDKFLGAKRLYPLNYIVVLRKE